jgi:hypothetical protein
MGEVVDSISAGNSIKFFVECRGCQSDCRGRANSVKLNFFAGFRSVLFRFEFRNWLFGMPRNEHFLPRNNRNRSESINRNFSERNSVPNPEVRQHKILFSEYKILNHGVFEKITRRFVKVVKLFIIQSGRGRGS